MQNNLSTIDPGLLEGVTGGTSGTTTEDQLAQAIQGIATSLADLVNGRQHQSPFQQMMPFLMMAMMMRRNNSPPPFWW